MNLLNIEYKNYKVDMNNFKHYLDHIIEIQNIGIEHDLDFQLIGHISLILLSNKIYRNPADLDIQINSKDTKKWFKFLAKDWSFIGDLNYINTLNSFFKNNFTKFASTNIENCSTIESDADIYKIENNNFFLFYHSKSNNLMKDPKFICHDPKKNISRNNPFIVINDDKFIIWFYTNSVSLYFQSFIIFYNENFEHKEIIECTFKYDYKVNNEIYACWSSQELDLIKFQNCYYRIFISKERFSLKLKNKKTKILMELFINKNNLNNYSIPVIFDSNNSLLKSIITIKFNNKFLKVAHPYNCFNHKYGREKDIDDIEVYKDLLEKYPLG